MTKNLNRIYLNDKTKEVLVNIYGYKKWNRRLLNKILKENFDTLWLKAYRAGYFMKIDIK